MIFEKILVVYKKSNYEKYILEDHYLKLKRHKALTKPLLDSHRNHYRSLERVEKTLKDLGLKFSMMVRSHAFSEKKFDLVISVGGDGTFLDASQFMITKPLLGINSNPAESIGHFCPVFSKELHAFLQKRSFPVTLISRLKVKIDGKVQAPVLNDVLITNIHPASTSRYNIQIGREKEEQKSSGIWVSTSMGSTAAILGAGGRHLDYRGTKFQVKIREPYIQKGMRCKMDKIILSEKQQVKVLSKMRDGMVFMDGTKRVATFIFGSRLVVSGDAPKLKMLGKK
jgi:NAD+ kinase